MVTLRIKGSVIASFLCCIASFFLAPAMAAMPDKNVLLRQLDKNHAADSTLWQTLLQLKNGAPLNPNYRGYLTTPVSAKDELVATVNLVFSSPHQACRYPARKLFIEKLLKLPLGTLTEQPCSDFDEFLDRVPQDKAYLVFAAENVTSASSMMGHIMLRFDGNNTDDIPVQHGVTFFTELSSFNVPILLYDTLIKGKPGIFQVAPYAPFAQHYRHTEQRNVWEYELALSPFEKSLIAGLIWELGQFSPDYFFHTYNCATVTQFLLSLARPSQLHEMDFIVTPADVVRFARDQDLVDRTTLLPSAKWKAQALEATLPVNQSKYMRSALKNGKTDQLDFALSSEDFMRFEYASSVNTLLRQRRMIKESRYQNNARHLQALRSDFKAMALDVSEYKNPINNSKEALFAAGLTWFQSTPSVSMRFFPVASDIDSDNRNYAGETALSLADIEVLYSPETSDLQLDSLWLYNMLSRVPYDEIHGDFSSGLKVGLNRVFDHTLTRQLVVQTEVSAGITLPWSPNGGVFAESGLGVTADQHTLQIYLAPRAGLYAYLRHNTKLRIEAAWNVNQYKHSQVGRLDMHLTHFINPAWSVNTQWSRLFADKDETWMAVNLRYRF